MYSYDYSLLMNPGGQEEDKPPLTPPRFRKITSVQSCFRLKGNYLQFSEGSGFLSLIRNGFPKVTEMQSGTLPTQQGGQGFRIVFLTLTLYPSQAQRVALHDIM